MPMFEEAAPRGDSTSQIASPVHTPAQCATADYIMELSGQLSRLADEAGLDLLGYLLEMVRVEARRAKSKTQVISTP